jgi:hypothetical protein
VARGFGGGRARFESNGPPSGGSRRADILWAIARAKGLTTSERCVLYVIESYVSPRQRASGWCWPAVASVADGAGLGERQTQALLRGVAAKGWLEIRAHSVRGHQSTNWYRVTPPSTIPMPETNDAEAVTEPDEVH